MHEFEGLSDAKTLDAFYKTQDFPLETYHSDNHFILHLDDHHVNRRTMHIHVTKHFFNQECVIAHI